MLTCWPSEGTGTACGGSTTSSPLPTKHNTTRISISRRNRGRGRDRGRDGRQVRPLWAGVWERCGLQPLRDASVSVLPPALRWLPGGLLRRLLLPQVCVHECVCATVCVWVGERGSLVFLSRTNCQNQPTSTLKPSQCPHTHTHTHACSLAASYDLHFDRTFCFSCLDIEQRARQAQMPAPPSFPRAPPSFQYGLAGGGRA